MQSSFKTHPVGLWKRAKRNEQDTKKLLSLRLSFTSFSLFLLLQDAKQGQGQNAKPGWRPHLPLSFDEAAFNKSTGRSGFCCKDLPPPFKLWSSGKSSENVLTPARVLLCCFKETVHFAPDALHTFCICLPTKASKAPALHTHRPWILPTAVSAARRATPLLRDGWTTFNEEPLKSNERPSEDWVRCECWLGIKCWTIDPGASAVYVPQSLISNMRWCEKANKGLQTFTLCIWPHFTAKLLRFIHSR